MSKEKPLKIVTIEEIKQKYCSHCPNNPNAKEPFIETKEIKTDAGVYDKIVAKGKNPSCMLCFDVYNLAEELDRFLT